MKRRQLAEEAVNQIEKVFGEYPGHRRAHARGSVYEAIFSSNGNASALTTASHFQPGKVQALVRFSHFSPDPTWADIMSPAKGMAVQFKLAEGEVTNIVGVTAPIFLAKTPEVFTEMLRVMKSFKNGKPRFADLAEVMTQYPESRAVIEILKKMQAPKSFATGLYHSNHAFYFHNDKGKKQPIKYEWEPEAGVEDLSLTDAAAMPIDYYKAEFEDRISQGPVNFRLNIVIGTDEDPTDDPTVEWPAERERIHIGSLSIQKQAPYAADTLFDPTVMTEGISCSEDRILNFRQDAYQVSHSRRKKGQ
ncbi:catalase family peroxidase [Planococcus salinus]|uniref:Catalase-related peroxidase n=1 Tax=Planococcus salinus TaxID=1848460 RepID=A0A3M8P639_9BACL|nr:catalase family peroxidase [Planococcus salinus]RNF39125.1 catalase family peroxidase [Planococcus salinus]